MACVADSSDVERILKSHEAQSNGAVAMVRSTRFFCRVEVDINDVIEHPDRCADGGAQFFLIDPFFCDMLC